MDIIIRKKVAAPVVAEPIVSRAPKQAPKLLLDGQCRLVVEKAPNAIIAWWLIASYLYYHHNVSILSDELYDQMAKDMLEYWGDLEHQHKFLITKDDLRAGTLYRLNADDYPTRVKAAASQVAKVDMGLTISI
jgi:DNA ligase-like, N-terminal NAD+-binding domain